MNKLRFSLLAFMWILFGCGTLVPSQSIVPTNTATQTVSPSATLTPVVLLTPTETVSPTATVPVRRNRHLDLPGGLSIEEYPIADTSEEIWSIWSFVYAQHKDIGAEYLLPKVEGGQLNNGKIFRVEESNGINAFLDGKRVAKLDCRYLTSFAAITAWAYEDHWIIQTQCNLKKSTDITFTDGKVIVKVDKTTYDVIWDGVSLNATQGYQASFAFQLLAGKPFYLFLRDDQVWLNYAGEEILLGYDEVKLNYCCMSEPPAPSHYEKMITFYATQGDQLYFVVIDPFK
jgi:hypothetical protein